MTNDDDRSSLDHEFYLNMYVVVVVVQHLFDLLFL